jgi:hypothetical protein
VQAYSTDKQETLQLAIKKRPLQPKGTLRIFPRESYPGEAHPGNSLSRTGDARECAVAKVQGTACNERSPVCNGDGHALVVGGVGHSQACTERESLVGGCKAVSIKAATICRS